MDLPVLLAAAFLFGPFPSGLIAFVGLVDLREFRHELSLTCALYNRSQKALSVTAAALVFEALNAHLGSWPRAMFGALLALLADCLVNYSLITFASMLLHGTSPRLVLSRMRFGRIGVFILAYSCLGLLGLILVETYVRLGPWALISFPVPIVLARQAFSHGFGLEAAGRAIRQQGEALEHVSSSIADERRDERSRIASSLHDDVLQSLYNVTIHAQVIREDLRAGRLLALDDDVPALLRASEEASSTLRDVIQDIRQSPLGRKGLVDTLRLLLDEVQDGSGLPIHRRLGRVVASPSVQLVAYQVVKEAVVNAIKHANPAAVWVTVETDLMGLSVTVEDDGLGLHPSSADPGRHFGMQLMQERVDSVGGTLRVLGREPSGLTVTAELPADTNHGSGP